MITQTRGKELVFKAAWDMYPSNEHYIRLQPIPNALQVGNAMVDIYQLHRRPRHTKEVADFNWILIGQGTLVQLVADLQLDKSRRATSVCE